MKIPTIKSENGAIVLETIIPFKAVNYAELRETLKVNPIKENRNILIECIDARMYECYCNLHANLNNVIGNNGMTVVYNDKDGKTRMFNMPSWEAMRDVRKALEQNCFDHYSVEMTDQLLKSVILGPVPKSCFKNYDVLVRYLLESFIVAKL